MDNPSAIPQVPAIQMRGVAVGAISDQSRLLVEEINWTVASGDYWVVAGLQGAGKSDLLLMTGGLMPPARGAYRLFGQEMPIFDEARLKERLRLGLVFDGGQLFNHLTVSENVALPLRYHRNLSRAEAEPEVGAILESLELAPWLGSRAGAQTRSGAGGQPAYGPGPAPNQLVARFSGSIVARPSLAGPTASDPRGHNSRPAPVERPRPAIRHARKPAPCRARHLDTSRGGKPGVGVNRKLSNGVIERWSVGFLRHPITPPLHAPVFFTWPCKI